MILSKLIASLVIGGCYFTFSLACAAQSSYQCIIRESVELQANGTISRPETSMFGQRFSIDRESGWITGPEKGFPWSFRDATIKVLARGSRENNFVVVIHSPAAKDGVHLTLIRVQESAESAIKPFLATSGVTTYSGTCE